jgi:hypothetical protein
MKGTAQNAATRARSTQTKRGFRRLAGEDAASMGPAGVDNSVFIETFSVRSGCTAIAFYRYFAVRVRFLV